MIKAIIFDFDGVILDSMPIKTDAFREIFKSFAPDAVEELVKYHIQNGGISRFVKIRYFFETILGEYTSNCDVMRYADMFSDVVVKNLSDSKYLISETIEFIKSRHGKERLFVASGAEQNELRFLCDRFALTPYFEKILGSPTPKTALLASILDGYALGALDCVMIGDSINDYEAASQNGIPFAGYNNQDLKTIGYYIESFGDFELGALNERV